MIKSLLILLFIIVIAIFGFLNYISWGIVIGFFIIYVFSLGLLTEMKEIKAKEILKIFLTLKMDDIENNINGALKKLESESRIKEKISRKRKEIIEWLNKL